MRPLALQMAKLSVHDSHIDKEDGIIRIKALCAHTRAHTFMRNSNAIGWSGVSRADMNSEVSLILETQFYYSVQ